MFPHWWLFTTCTRPELYESEVLPFRHSLMGPLVTAIWPKRREEQAVLYSTLQHIVHVSKLPYLLLRGLEYTTAATANCSETISSSWTVLGPALWLLTTHYMYTFMSILWCRRGYTFWPIRLLKKKAPFPKSAITVWIESAIICALQSAIRFWQIWSILPG